MRKATIIMTCVSLLLAVTWVAKADSLYLTANFNNIYLTGSGLNNPVGGGSIAGSKLNGKLLPYDFCIGLYTDVYVPKTYDAFVTNNGTVNGGNVKINNAGEIAWLLTTYASPQMTHDQQVAMQAAIWHIEYSTPGNIGLSTSAYGSDVLNYFKTYIGDVNNGVYKHNDFSLTGFDWITPYSYNECNHTYTYYQPQITATPEPSSLLLILSGLFSLYGLKIFRKKFQTA